MAQPYEVAESSSFISSAADSSVIVGTNNSGLDLMTFVFLNNNPVIVVDDKENISFQTIQKQKVASISMGIGQAQKFYESLKQIFEEDLPKMQAEKASQKGGNN